MVRVQKANMKLASTCHIQWLWLMMFRIWCCNRHSNRMRSITIVSSPFPFAGALTSPFVFLLQLINTSKKRQKLRPKKTTKWRRKSTIEITLKTTSTTARSILFSIYIYIWCMRVDGAWECACDYDIFCCLRTAHCWRERKIKKWKIKFSHSPSFFRISMSMSKSILWSTKFQRFVIVFRVCVCVRVARFMCAIIHHSQVLSRGKLFICRMKRMKRKEKESRWTWCGSNRQRLL